MHDHSLSVEKKLTIDAYVHYLQPTVVEDLENLKLQYSSGALGIKTKLVFNTWETDYPLHIFWAPLGKAFDRYTSDQLFLEFSVQLNRYLVGYFFI